MRVPCRDKATLFIFLFQNKNKLDLIYIIPWFIGEVFIHAVVPCYFVYQLTKVSILSLDGMMYAAMAVILLDRLELKSLKEIKK